MVQLSHPHMTTGQMTALARWTFVDKVMSLLFNTLYKFVIYFLPLINFQVNSNVTSFLPGVPGIVPSFLWASAILRACRQQCPNQQFIVYVSSIRLRTEQFHFCVPISNALHSVCHAEETQWWMNDFMKWWMMISICFYFQLCKASCLLLHLWHLK